MIVLSTADLQHLKDYITFHILNDSTGLLDQKTYDLAFDFYNRTMTGQQEPKDLWKRAVSAADGVLGEAIGMEYAKIYFPAAAKKRMEKMIEHLQKSLGQHIRNLTWMSDKTKIQALEKLGTFRAKIGYPDKLRDFSKLNIHKDLSLYDISNEAARFEDEFWLDKIGAPVDRELWYMHAHTVNAYYDPQTNEICFPAGILQPPFFDMNADGAYNYGAIGVVIGHEMTHGFDDKGRQFDSIGNLRDWWTQADADKFNALAKVMGDHFDKIEVAPGLHANGEFTMGENLADYGGGTISWTAYRSDTNDQSLPTVDGLTPGMRFFLGWANLWAINITDEEIVNLTKTDVHSLGRWRVNGIFPHIDAWYEAFDIGSDSPMYIAPEKRVRLW
ncbi:hypothetical protein FACS18945_3630 [Bacteroidia bacterium]|nr:hypothetical protein FACS18945_3630 [Bacteroidia bacterium]